LILLAHAGWRHAPRIKIEVGTRRQEEVPPTMSNHPMSRTALRSVQKNALVKQETANMNAVANICDIIYNNVIETVNESNDTLYQHEIPFNDPFYKKYIGQIVKRLKILFPDCQVNHVIMTRSYDGKLYDITKIDDKIASYIKEAINNTYIVIDWS
jgi:hypothetical protein